MNFRRGDVCHMVQVHPFNRSCGNFYFYLELKLSLIITFFPWKYILGITAKVDNDFIIFCDTLYHDGGRENILFNSQYGVIFPSSGK